MAPPLLILKDIQLSFGGTPLFEGVSFSLQEETKACLVGRNGSGKSTLLKIIAAHLESDAGDFSLRPQTTLAYLPQNPDFSGAATLVDYVRQGLPPSQQDALFRCEEQLALVGLDPNLDLNTLSGGEARRADLARALITDPDLLLLDEPTNHLDIETILWLEGFLRSYRKALMVISHDRTFLKKVTNKTLWLDRGRVRELNKGFEHFEAWSEGILAQEERERDKLTKRIVEETRWSHQGITARRKRNQGRLRRLESLREERARQGGADRTLKLQAEEGSASGKAVVEAHQLYKSYGDKKIVHNFSLRVLRGDRIGVVGPNGAGKSTLLHLLTGRLKPDQGKVKLGTNLTPLYIDQKRQALDPQKTLWDTLCDKGGDQVMVQGVPRHVVGYLKDFLFSPDQIRSPVGSLSGGEQNRLLLAKQLAVPSNLLVLDEPTNDLDVESLDLLEEILSEYTGTIFLVSHDRDFLDRLVTSTLFLEEAGKVTLYAGGYTDALNQQKKGGPAWTKSSSTKSRKTASPSDTGSPDSTSPAAPSPSFKKEAKNRLSYKEGWRLEKLPQEMATTEAALTDLRQQLADPGLYQQDPARFDALSLELLTLEETLEALENEWLSLEEKRQNLEDEGG